MEDKRPTVKVSGNYLILIIDACPLSMSCRRTQYILLSYFRLLYGPKINIEEEDIKKGSVPEWKLQPKVSYDDDEGDD